MINAKLPKGMTSLAHCFMICDKQSIEIIIRLNYVFVDDPEKIYFWLTTKNLNLGGVAPLKLMQLGRGHKVLQFIEDANEGNSP